MSDNAEFECLRAYATCIKIPIGKLDTHDSEGAATIINKMSCLVDESLSLLAGTIDPKTHEDLAAQEIHLLWERLVNTSLVPSVGASTIGKAQLTILRLTRRFDRRKLPERYAMILAFMPDNQIKEDAYCVFENLVP